jgi:hypothetical protein
MKIRKTPSFALSIRLVPSVCHCHPWCSSVTTPVRSSPLLSVFPDVCSTIYRMLMLNVVTFKFKLLMFIDFVLMTLYNKEQCHCSIWPGHIT